MAGGTWIMRASLRGERRKAVHVVLDGIDELHEFQADTLTRIGAMTTHARIAQLTEPALAALARAAATSAFPAVRNVATLGGNLRATPFPEADLVPALLASEARVELAGRRGALTTGIEEFLAAPRPAEELVVSAVIPAPARRISGYQRLTVRGGGEYPVASVALSADVRDDGLVEAARVAIGSVESTARLCLEAGRTLVGRPLTADTAEAAGRVAAQECTPREDAGAPGWYRAAVLPELLRRIGASIAGGATQA